MRKVLFLMFLLLLMGLGAAGVKAQVRIGGNTQPNPAAVLDLNAGDATTGNQGLVLPRVALTSNTMVLPGVPQNLTGMMVYNTITTGGVGVGTIGVYVWTGAQWNKANLPSVQASDSDFVLRFNGVNWVPARIFRMTPQTLTGSLSTSVPITWNKIADFTIHPTSDLVSGEYVRIVVPGLIPNDFCMIDGVGSTTSSEAGILEVFVFTAWPAAFPVPCRCYRPSA